ncbi:hypothetical protein AGMMS49925_07240 [Deltaproteobacteria bacterium]|nr:hypothetical protein AGMMS49925_07240 [Deltaproteobacteria bacterium]
MRVAGQFTVESLSPHRMLAVDENDELIDPLDKAVQDEGKDFAAMILEELKISGVQQKSCSPPSSPGRAAIYAPKAPIGKVGGA